jgi:hypothetical protein
VGIAKALYVGTTANIAGTTNLAGLTASSAVATDASKNLVSVTNTGTGNNVLATSPTLVTPVLGVASATSITVAAGTVSDPAITTTGDTNTGIFFPAADTIAFAEGGAEAMRIDSSGNVGIGVTPAVKLDVYNSAAAAPNNEILRLRYVTSTTAGHSGDLNFTNGTGTVIGRISNVIQDSLNVSLAFSTFSSSMAERMRIDSLGNVGIGTTSPVTKLDVNGPASVTSFTGTTRLGVTVQGATSTNDYSGIDFTISASSPRARIASVSGGGGSSLSFGTSNNYASGITNTAMTIDPNGGITLSSLAGVGSRAVNASAAGVLSAASDSSLKEEVTNSHIAGLAEILQIQPKMYKWKEDIAIRGDDAAIELGFFANDVAPIIPSAAPKGNDGLYGFYDRSITAALVKAIQEQQALIQSLTTRITALEQA